MAFMKGGGEPIECLVLGNTIVHAPRSRIHNLEFKSKVRNLEFKSKVHNPEFTVQGSTVYIAGRKLVCIKKS